MLSQVLFKDRYQAGILLASKLAAYQGSSARVLGVARGGIVVAKAIVQTLHMPLDVLVVKKLASPHNPEYAIGAVAPDSVSLIYWSAAHRVGVDERYVQESIRDKSHLIRQQTLKYRKGRKPLDISDKTIIVVDDGAATGATMEVAIRWLRAKHARTICVALPVASEEATRRLSPEVDSCIVYDTVKDLSAVGAFYESFPQVTDEEVIRILQENI